MIFTPQLSIHGKSKPATAVRAVCTGPALAAQTLRPADFTLLNRQFKVKVTSLLSK
jgi:hypothetical protein